ncbi:LysR family transcriptional regulator [Raoultibacter phocaeensis]|uniref:LysR family transcriptional regulator n=1 Tax=Raoultibacter phocaeensis TaxID=2479841 RepID=UPI0015D5776D|nr:LysR family transcriptional regulator [Raoultibacter phocaeensis]
MNIEYLHYFLDVAKTKSITRAAKLNFISPQGMSRAMNELEKELGCELLIRYSNKLVLSPIGEELAPKIADVVDGYTGILEYAAAKSQVQLTGGHSIQLECQNVAMLAFLTQQAKDYIFGCRDIHFRESQNSQIRHDLLANNANDPAGANPIIGLVCFFNQDRSTNMGGIDDLEEKGYQYRPYLKTYDKVMVNAQSPLAKKDTLSDEDIVSKPLVSTNTYLYSVLSKRFGQSAIEFSSSDFSLRKSMVERDSAVSFLPAIAALTMADEAGFVLRDMEHSYEVEIGFVGMESDLESSCFQGLMRILDEFYRAHEDSGLYALCR